MGSKTGGFSTGPLRRWAPLKVLPVAVDCALWRVSGKLAPAAFWVTARVYVAVGISGAIQRLQGMGRATKVAAINPDPACDMIKRADLSVIGDAALVLRRCWRLWISGGKTTCGMQLNRAHTLNPLPLRAGQGEALTERDS